MKVLKARKFYECWMSPFSTDPLKAGVGKVADGKGIRTSTERDTTPWHKINVLWFTVGQPAVSSVYCETEVLKPAAANVMMLEKQSWIFIYLRVI
jgi:hypothetical protein